MGNIAMKVPYSFWASLFLLAGSCLPGVAQTQEKVDFERDVKPVLDRSCSACHGAKAQMGGLRLDAKGTAMAGGQSGKAIMPGDGAHSPLYLRTVGAGDQPRMPMGGKPLPPEQLAILKRWIDEGAAWPDGVGAQNAAVKKHWAYVAPVRPALPVVRESAWPRNPVDRFVLARLEKEGLPHSPETDKITLLRRVSLDLTGLPPTAAEVKAFLADSSPRAYEKQVERLLASPHYGERWARIWLDAARYADSDGFEKDKPRWVWFYRDWVIHAFNRDLPYDQFLEQQLAGDLMARTAKSAAEAQELRVATGFLRNSMINEEGGIDPEQFRMEAMFDRMDAVGKAMLGVTIQCAQCHNHKFDPLTQEEYYKLFAFLNNSHESNAAVYTPDERKLREQVLSRVARLESALEKRMPDWRARLKAMSSQPGDWTTVNLAAEDISTGGQKFLEMGDGSMLASGYAPTKSRVKLQGKTAATGITAMRLELLMDPNLPRGGPGRSIKGTGALTEFEAEVAPVDDPAKVTPVKFVRALADVNLKEAPIDAIYRDKEELAGKKEPRVTGPVAYAIDGDDKTAWGIDDGPARRNQPRNAVFIASKPFGFPGGTLVTVYLKQNHGGWNSDDNQNYNMGRMRVSVTTLAEPKPVLPESFELLRERVPEWAAENAEIEKVWSGHPEGSTQLVLNERAERRMTNILSRGDFLKPGKTVEPGVPAFLHALPAKLTPDEPARLTFARWVAARNSPTTARSFVNRVWQSYFGTGLVETPEDLGKQSPAPSHPELLDWLAVEFMDGGWKVKDLHRAIVTSATYRQSSRLTPELKERDLFNRLLARGPRVRVEGEIVRDIALAASGLLNGEVGGPSVFPPAPSFLFQPPASYGPKVWDEAKGTERYRRALYTFRYRSVPYPMLTNFDTPNGDIACVRRTRSNTPLQALTTLNEPLFFEAAQALGKLTMHDGGATDRQRLVFAFERCTSRKPTAAEEAELTAFLNKQQKRFQEPERAWTAMARLLLNLDETITKE